VGCVNNSRSLKQDKEIFFKLSLDQEYSIHPVISVVISEIILQFLFKNATTKRKSIRHNMISIAATAALILLIKYQ
jgi:hypothetical protein